MVHRPVMLSPFFIVLYVYGNGPRKNWTKTRKKTEKSKLEVVLEAGGDGRNEK